MRVVHDGKFVRLTLDAGQLAEARRLAADWQFRKDEAGVWDRHVEDASSGVLSGYDTHFEALHGHVGTADYLSGKLIVLKGEEGLRGRPEHPDMNVPHADGRLIPVGVVATQGSMRDFLIPYHKKREFLTSAVTVLAWCSPTHPTWVTLAGWITPNDWLGKTNKRVQSEFGVLGDHPDHPTWFYRWFNSRSMLSLPAYFGRPLP